MKWILLESVHPLQMNKLDHEIEVFGFVRRRYIHKCEQTVDTHEWATPEGVRLLPTYAFFQIFIKGIYIKYFFNYS